MKKFLIGALVLLIIVVSFLAYILKQEFTYRKLMREIFFEVAATYTDIANLIKEKNYEKINSECPNLINKHVELLKRVSLVKVPEKHTQSYSYMKNSIIDLNSGIVKICDGVTKNSTEILLQGLESTKSAETKMLKGKETFLEE